MINLYTAGSLVDVIEKDDLCDNEIGVTLDGAYICHRMAFIINGLYEFDIAVRNLKKIYNIQQIKRVNFFSLNSDNLNKLLEEHQDASF